MSYSILFYHDIQKISLPNDKCIVITDLNIVKHLKNTLAISEVPVEM